MGNALQLILKYGQYLKYLPLLVNLITFIRTAEKKFREAGSGADKAAWVQQQFSALVDGAESAGLIGAKFAAALREGSLQLISIFVQGMKDAQGVVPPINADAIPVETVLDVQPDFGKVLPGYDVWQKGEESQWIAKLSGTVLAAPWRLVFVTN